MRASQEELNSIKQSWIQKRKLEFLKGIKNNEHCLQLMFLPPYNPNLNLIEGLWKWLIEKVNYNVFYKIVPEIRKNVNAFLATKLSSFRNPYSFLSEETPSIGVSSLFLTYYKECVQQYGNYSNNYLRV